MISAVNKCSCSLICFKNRVNAVGALYGYLIKCGAYSPAYIVKAYLFVKEKLNCTLVGTVHNTSRRSACFGSPDSRSKAWKSLHIRLFKGKLAIIGEGKLT